MTHDATKRHLRSIRLPGYDYAQPGAYFVTICTQNRECLFGDVIDGQMVVRGPGHMVQAVWRELPQHYEGVQMDALVVMPNHVHGVIILVGAGPRACPDGPEQPPAVTRQPRRVSPTLSLPDVVQRFKSLTTARYRHGVRQSGWQPFAGRLWQRNYYERVVRNDRELRAVCRYSEENPARWADDPENPDNVGAHGGAPRHGTPRPGAADL